MAPRGATYIITEPEYEIINTLKFPILHLQLDTDFKNISLYVILAWLKSSAFLWYIHTAFGDTDFYTPSIYEKIKIPTQLLNSDTSAIIENKVKDILKIEKEFLISQEEILKAGSIDLQDEQWAEIAWGA